MSSAQTAVDAPLLATMAQDGFDGRVILAQAADGDDHGADAHAADDGHTEAADAHAEHADDHGADHAEGGIPTEVWLALALVVLGAVVFKRVKAGVLGALDGRAQAIRQELDEAQRLREEAQAVLADYQRRYRDAMKDAEEIIAHARRDAERLRAQAEVDIAETLRRREQLAMDRIAHAESQALAEVRDQAVDAAIAASRDLIAGQMDDERSAALVDRAIADMDGKLH